MKNAFVHSLIDHSDRIGVSRLSKSFVAGLNRRLELFDRSFKCGLEHLVLKRLGFGHLNTLFC